MVGKTFQVTAQAQKHTGPWGWSPWSWKVPGTKVHGVKEEVSHEELQQAGRFGFWIQQLEHDLSRT